MTMNKTIMSDTYRTWQDNIYAFADAVRFKPTFQQRQLLDAVQRGEPAIACRSGQGPGKTTATVVVGLWRTIRKYMAKTLVTAPTMRQCKDIWLAEARLRMQHADPLLRKLVQISNTRLTIAGVRDWGVELVTSTNVESAQGYHRPDLTIICEEASGIDRETIEQYKGTLSNPNPLMVMIGNPNTRDCAFYDCFTAERRRWCCLHWNAEETPASEWFDPARNQRLAEEYGQDSDVYRVRVLGEFPNIDPNCLIGMDDVERAIPKGDWMYRCVRMNKVRQFGLDFARYGGDENTVFRRSGNAIVAWNFWARTDPNDVVAHAFQMQAEAGWSNSDTMYVVDAGGMGQGCLKQFYTAHKHVYEFHNQGTPTDSAYFNKITQAWFQFAKLLRTGVACIPDDRILHEQLTTRQYVIHPETGKIKIESKDDYKERGYPSPDRAEACILSFWDSPIVEGQSASHSFRTPRAGSSVHERLASGDRR